MRKISTMISQVAPIDIEQPAESSLLTELKTNFAAFHAGTNQRSALTTEDRQTLDGFNTAAAAYLALAKREAFEDRTWGTGEAPAAAMALPNLIADFVAVSSSDVELQLSGGGDPINTPAIESATVRGVLSRKGDAVLAAIDAAMAAGFERIANSHAARQSMEQRVRYYLSIPAVRALIAAFIAIKSYYGEENSSADFSVSTSTMNALHGVMQHHSFTMAHRGNAVPNPPETAVGMWRRWMPMAAELIAAERREAA